jgi:hypothetical protein
MDSDTTGNICLETATSAVLMLDIPRLLHHFHHHHDAYTICTPSRASSHVPALGSEQDVPQVYCHQGPFSAFTRIIRIFDDWLQESYQQTSCFLCGAIISFFFSPTGVLCWSDRFFLGSEILPKCPFLLIVTFNRSMANSSIRRKLVLWIGVSILMDLTLLDCHEPSRR